MTEQSQFSISTRRVPRPRPRAECCGQPETGQGAQSTALAALAVLAAGCLAAQSVVAGNPLGPYADSGSCSYDCGFMEQDWNWWADYRPTNANLSIVVGSLNFSGPYAVAYQATQSWITGSLPGISTSITHDLQEIRQIDAAIAAAGGNATPAQQAELAADFTDLAGQLARNLALADAALQQVARFISWQQGQGEIIDTELVSSQAYIKNNAGATENNLIGQIACGAGDVQNSYAAMFADVAGKYVTMTNSVRPVDQDFQTAVQAVQLVTGVFLGLQSDSDLIGQRLDSAQALPPADPVRTMDLNIASILWTDFMHTATAQLQG